MRWATLYARSRQLPAAFGALLVATSGVWFLGRDSWDGILAALALTTAVAVAAIGLSGQDPDPAGLLQGVGLAQLLDHDGVDSGDLQLGCQRQPYWPRSDDQDLTVNFHFRSDPA